MRTWAIIMAMLVEFLLLSGCRKLNDMPPASITKVVQSTQFANGITYSILVVLVDDFGQMTTSDGKITLTIFETVWKEEDGAKHVAGEEKIYTTRVDVRKGDFVKDKLSIKTIDQVLLPGFNPPSQKEELLIYFPIKLPSDLALKSGRKEIIFETSKGKILKYGGI